MDTSLSLQPLSLPIPEEILEQVISLTFFGDRVENAFGSRTSAFSLMLTCKAFYRISKPFLYSCLYLRTRGQSEKLAETFRNQPSLATYIRTIRVECPSASEAFCEAVQILSNSNRPAPHVFDLLDVGLILERSSTSHQKAGLSRSKEDLGRLNSALSVCPDTKCLIVRHDAYVTCGSVISFTHALASGVNRWKRLETVDLRLRPTPLPTASGSPRPDPLAEALANAPNLRVIRARQPTLLNAFLLDVAKSPSLQRIELINTTSGLLDPASFFSPFLRLPFLAVGRRRSQNTDSTPVNSRPRQPEWDETDCKLPLGDVCHDPKILEAATAELERQLTNEPQTLFSSQIIAHPHLCALIRAGRLQLIIERLLSARKQRSLGGDSYEHREYGSGTYPSVCCQVGQNPTRRDIESCLVLRTAPQGV